MRLAPLRLLAALVPPVIPSAEVGVSGLSSLSLSSEAFFKMEVSRLYAEEVRSLQKAREHVLGLMGVGQEMLGNPHDH